jgi:putative transposase
VFHKVRKRNEKLRACIKEQVKLHRFAGYRSIWGVLRDLGWVVNHKRVYRIWRLDGLKWPKKRKRRKLRLGTKREHEAKKPGDVWALDFMHDSTRTGQKLKILTGIDEFTRQAVVLFPATSIPATKLIEQLEIAIAKWGKPKIIRTDNGPEFTSGRFAMWLKSKNIQHAPIAPGKPWQNGNNESFNSTTRRELLNAELFESVLEARVLHQDYMDYYNNQRPHTSLGYKSPTEFTKSWYRQNALN